MSDKFQLANLSLVLPNNVQILQRVSFNVPAGKITCVIGPSGSGKSTLLRCLNRLWEPPPTTVFLDGVDITTISVLELRRRVGMLFQSAAIFPGTVAENIAYGPALTGQILTSTEIDALLERVSLPGDFARKPAGELSGGQAQRVALARTLANKPEALLLDEPTSALDPAATHHVEETIFKLRDRLGLTVIWVSHAIEQVQRVADQVILLVDGAVAEIGSPAHLLESGHHLTEEFAAGRL